MAQGDTLRRYLDAGVVFTQLTRERAEAIVRDLVKNGEIAKKEAEKRVEDLLERSRENAEALVAVVRKEVASQLQVLGIDATDPPGPPAAPTAPPTDTADVAKPEQAPPKKGASKKGASKQEPASPKRAGTKKPSAKKGPAKAPGTKKAAAKKKAAKKSPPDKGETQPRGTSG